MKQAPDHQADLLSDMNGLKSHGLFIFTPFFLGGISKRSLPSLKEKVNIAYQRGAVFLT